MRFITLQNTAYKTLLAHQNLEQKPAIMNNVTEYEPTKVRMLIQPKASMIIVIRYAENRTLSNRQRILLLIKATEFNNAWSTRF